MGGSRHSEPLCPCAQRYRTGRSMELEREQPSLGRRAQAVLLSARREPIPAIMRRLGVSRPTVTAWLTRFEAMGVAAFGRDRVRPPGEADGRVLRHIATATGARPRELGIDRRTWTLPALRQYLVRAGVVPAISLESVRSHCERRESVSGQLEHA